MKLFMILVGCSPASRNIEQHDVFFTIGQSINDIISDIGDFWPDGGKLHLDAWREVSIVDGYQITISDSRMKEDKTAEKLFFLNLGGYKKEVFEEFHYKMLVVSNEKSHAIMQAKQTSFFQHTGFKGATSHIDDKYGIDVDDIYQIEDILPKKIREQFNLTIVPADKNAEADTIHLGYFPLSKFK